jgi:hypothetical protein
VPVVLSHIFSFTVYARAWWTGFMHPAGLSKFKIFMKNVQFLRKSTACK